MPRLPRFSRLLLLTVFTICILGLLKSADRLTRVNSVSDGIALDFELQPEPAVDSKISPTPPTPPPPRPLVTICDNVNCSNHLLTECAAHGFEKIPKIRHLLWKSEKMPKYFANQLVSWHKLMPNWKFVLWRDSDLSHFIKKFYPKYLAKFQSLKKKILKFDFVRYFLVHKFGGVYADIDYTLIRSIESFTDYPAVITIESEAHAIVTYGMRSWPLKKLANPALFMATPKHKFFEFCIDELKVRSAGHYLTFGGPEGLTDILYKYSARLPITANRTQQLYVPPSFSFYPYDNNSLLTSTSSYQGIVRNRLRVKCKDKSRIRKPELDRYCKNVVDLNPITDATVPVYAIHDNKKSVSTYDPNYREKDLVDLKSVLPNLVLGKEWIE